MAILVSRMKEKFPKKPLCQSNSVLPWPNSLLVIELLTANLLMLLKMELLMAELMMGCWFCRLAVIRANYP